MALIQRGKQIGKTLKSAARLRVIVGVLAKNGLQNVLEQAQLGRFLLKRIQSKSDETLSTGERVRKSFEELGPTFIKLGQLLSTRPDLIPTDWVEEFRKLHDNVQSIPYNKILEVLDQQYGSTKNVFSSIEETPLASASIAQVHQARLITGEDVVIKVQRPGIIETISNDLNVLYTIAQLLEKYVPETRPYKPVSIVDEFFKTMELETNFIIEANNMLRFKDNFKEDPRVKIPKVYVEHSGSRVLVQELLKGTQLSHLNQSHQKDIDSKKIAHDGINLFFSMVFKHKFFHGDLHAGNLFILENNQIGLVDFGVVGRISSRVRDSIANMFVALSSEDYERLAYEYVDLAPYSENIDVDLFAQDLRDLIAPYFGLSFKNVNTGKLLLDTTSLASKHGVSLPSELILFFKSVMTVEGMGRLIVKDYDLLSDIKEISLEILKSKYDPQKLLKDVVHLTRDSSNLIYSLPRQLKQIFRRLNTPDHRWKVEIRDIDEIKKSIETSSNLLFLGLIISSLIVAGSLSLQFDNGYFISGLPAVSATCFILAILLGLLGFYNYIRK